MFPLLALALALVLERRLSSSSSSSFFSPLKGSVHLLRAFILQHRRSLLHCHAKPSSTLPRPCPSTSFPRCTTAAPASPPVAAPPFSASPFTLARRSPLLLPSSRLFRAHSTITTSNTNHFPSPFPFRSHSSIPLPSRVRIYSGCDYCASLFLNVWMDTVVDGGET